MLELSVQGMTCDHCADAITEAVTNVPGVVGLKVDLKAGRVVVQGTPDPQAVAAAIEREGYTVG